MTPRKAITERMKIDCLLELASWTAYSEDSPIKESSIYCPECGQPVLPDERIEWDHRHALVHGGAHHYANLRPLHYECHKKKTARDIAANAKVKRIQRGKKQTKRPIPGSRSSKLKKRMNGQVERRQGD